MTVDRVNFNDEAVARMDKEEFISSHIGLFWQDRDEKTRRKMLADVYDRIVKPETEHNEGK